MGQVRDPTFEYEATERDKAWSRGLVDRTNHGGIWAWPNAGIKFKFDHVNQIQIATFLEGDLEKS